MKEHDATEIAYKNGYKKGVEEMKERLKKEIAKHTVDSFQYFANGFIDQIAKEMLGGSHGT